MLWSSRCKNTHMQQVHRKKWGRLFHNVVHSPHIEPPIVSRKLGKLSFADEHRGPHIDKGRQLFHNFESGEIPNKHTASERRLPVVTSENAARKVPNTWKCPNFEPLTVMCSPVCSQEMGAATTTPTFTYTHQPLYIVVICLIFSEVPMYSYHYAMSPHKQNYQTKCPCNPNNALVVNKFHLKQNKRKNVPKKNRCKRENCSKFDACTFSVSSKRRWNTIKCTLRQTINADGLVLSVAWFDIVTSWVKSDAAINRLSYKITIANLTSIESNEIHP